MRLFRYLCISFGILVGVFVLAALVGIVGPSFAADTTPGSVTIPWGDWLGSVLTYAKEFVVLVLGTVVTLGVKKFVPSAVDVLQTAQVEQLLSRAVDYGIAATAGAVKGKEAHIAVVNEALEKAAEYAIDAAPALAGKLGETLRPKIIARLSAAGIVPQDAQISQASTLVVTN